MVNIKKSIILFTVVFATTFSVPCFARKSLYVQMPIKWHKLFKTNDGAGEAVAILEKIDAIGEAQQKRYHPDREMALECLRDLLEWNLDIYDLYVISPLPHTFFVVSKNLITHFAQDVQFVGKSHFVYAPKGACGALYAMARKIEHAGF